MIDNNTLFKKGMNKNVYRRLDPTTIATTFNAYGIHQAVVLVMQESGLYTPALFDTFKDRGDALQRAHYINANFILRNNTEGMPMHLVATDDTLAGLRERGYQV